MNGRDGEREKHWHEHFKVFAGDVSDVLKRFAPVSRHELERVESRLNKNHTSHERLPLPRAEIDQSSTTHLSRLENAHEPLKGETHKESAARLQAIDDFKAKTVSSQNSKRKGQITDSDLQHFFKEFEKYNLDDLKEFFDINNNKPLKKTGLYKTYKKNKDLLEFQREIMTKSKQKSRFF